MLLDPLRSAVYRSLTKKNTNKYNTSLERRTESSPMEEDGDDRLFQASEGARELAKIIQSLSMAPNLDGRSKYIAKDLLKGAQDLQSSLVMLTKLHESREKAGEEFGAHRSIRSKRFSLQEPKRSLKLKQRYEFMEEEIGVEEVKGSRRYEFEDSRHSVDGRKKKPPKLRSEFVEEDFGVGEIMISKKFGTRKSRFSINESSGCDTSQLKFKKSFEYMEEEIGMQRSFSKNNIGELKRTSAFKKTMEYTEEAKIGAEEIMPSKRFGTEEPRLSVDSIQELRRVIKDSLSKQNLLPLSPRADFDSRSELPRSPQMFRPQNVITKLMGLEEEKKKIHVMPRPTFDIEDRPKPRKTQVVEMPDTTQKTLHEVIAAVQFKGLLKSGQASSAFDASHFEKYKRSFIKEEDAPPIVIMKPLIMPHWEKRENQMNTFLLDKIAKKEENLDSVNLLTNTTQKLQRKEAYKSKALVEAKKEELKSINTDKHVSASKTKPSRIKYESKDKKTSRVKSVRKSTDIKTEEKHYEDGESNIIQEIADSLSKNRTMPGHDLSDEPIMETKPCIQEVKQENSRARSELEEDLMCLLLSSRSFINTAKELFPIDPRPQLTHKRKVKGEDVMRNAKLYLDCGKELMLRKASTCSLNSTFSSSLSQLAEEVSSVIHTLKSYSDVDVNVSSEGNLYLRLERDIKCNNAMASANWDIGWVNWACSEEAKEAAGEIEEYILDCIVQEIVQHSVLKYKKI